MGTIAVMEHVTLDGVMQAPGRADEDPHGGFEHGGWAQARNDLTIAETMGKHMPAGWNLLLGRRTYEQFFAFWPKQVDPDPDVSSLGGRPPGEMARFLNNVQKYVASTTLTGPLEWENSTLLEGDAVPAVAALKERGADFVVFGSGELVRALAWHGLVDTYVLMIHPLVLGMGKRLFVPESAYAELELVESVTTKTGVLVATYETTRRQR